LAGGPRATICDIACYPYTAMSPDGGISLDPYPAVRRWVADIEKLDGYLPLAM
jgi:glutathione S-transferase